MSGLVGGVGSKSGVIRSLSGVTAGTAAINIGNVRIVTGYVTMDDSTSSLSKGFYYNDATIRFSGFKVAPAVFMGASGDWHDSFPVGAIQSQISTTGARLRISGKRQDGIEDPNEIPWMAIGEAS